MSKIFQIAGKTRVYNTDGSGRDTYIGFGNGGNTKQYAPAQAWRKGELQTITMSSPGPKQQSAALKNVHYHSNGTGRDSYIHSDQGGFMNNCAVKSVNDRYLANLRQYTNTVQSHQFAIAQQSRQRTGGSPQKDFFVEGQCSVRSPKWQKELLARGGVQRTSVERLSLPKEVRLTFDGTQTLKSSFNGKSPNQDFLKSSRECNFTTNKEPMNSSRHHFEKYATAQKVPNRQSHLQVKIAELKKDEQKKVGARRNTVGGKVAKTMQDEFMM